MPATMPATDYGYGTIEDEWEAYKASLVTLCECGGEITEPGLYDLCEICEADAAEAWRDELAYDDRGL